MSALCGCPWDMIHCPHCGKHAPGLRHIERCHEAAIGEHWATHLRANPTPEPQEKP